MEKDFNELKEIVKNLYHLMDVKDLEKAITKIEEIENKVTSIKTENRWYRDAFKKIKVIVEKF